MNLIILFVVQQHARCSHDNCAASLETINSARWTPHMARMRIARVNGNAATAVVIHKKKLPISASCRGHMVLCVWYELEYV